MFHTAILKLSAPNHYWKIYAFFNVFRSIHVEGQISEHTEVSTFGPGRWRYTTPMYEIRPAVDFLNNKMPHNNKNLCVLLKELSLMILWCYLEAFL